MIFLDIKYEPLSDPPSSKFVSGAHGPRSVMQKWWGVGGGGVVAQRHDAARNLLTSLLSKVCKNVQVEPHLQPLDNEVMNLRSTSTSSDARSDVKAGGLSF